jgi:hypothetical protein
MEESLFGSTWLRCSLQQPARGTLATATTGCAHSIVHRPLYASKCPWSWSTAPNRSRIALPSALRTIAQLKRSFTVSLGYNGLVCLERSDVPLHPVRMPTLSNLLQFSSLSRYPTTRCSLVVSTYQNASVSDTRQPTNYPIQCVPMSRVLDKFAIAVNIVLWFHLYVHKHQCVNHLPLSCVNQPPTAAYSVFRSSSSIVRLISACRCKSAM